jgi:hypothetical protein
MPAEAYSGDAPQAYILRQPTERQAALTSLRELILQNLPDGFQETMQYGMITYVVPKRIFPAGYHVNPADALPFVSLANQKQYIALYHLGIYMDQALLDWFSTSYAALNIGKLDIGKSCIRLKNPAKIPYDLIAQLCRKISPETFVEAYQRSRTKS